jgi:hypothetical protein
VLPFPTDIYFSGSTDGTLNIQPANALIPNQAGLNSLDGFSTTAPIRARFGSAINPASLTASTVRVIQISTDNTTKAPGPPFRPLVFGQGFDFTVGLAADSASIVEIRPTRPLEASSSPTARGVGYLVVLTNGITTAAGAPVTPDADYAAFKAAVAADPTCASVTNAQARLLCQLTGGHLQIAQAFGVSPANVVLTFSFTTQSTRDALVRIGSTAQPGTFSLQATGLTTQQANPGLAGKANIFVGTLRVPYYLSRTSPVTTPWQAAPFVADPTSRHVTRFNPVPVATENQTIPLLVTVPNAASATGGTPPAGGWRVALFMHGLGGDRTNALAIADAFADAGFAVAAIDQALHGIVDPMNPFYARPPAPATGSIERTFDLDVWNNQTGAPGADGAVDLSGSTLLNNIGNAIVVRDILRQGAADLIVLARTAPGFDFNTDGTPDVNPGRIHYAGISLGGIVGGVFLGSSGDARTGTLAVPGGRFVDLIAKTSPTFGPRVSAGLAALGFPPGTTVFEQFFRDAQTIVDAGDPANYIAAAAASRPIHVIQVVGDGAGVLPDQVVPNSATQVLINAANLTRISTAGANLNPSGHRAYVNFVAGAHASLLSPTASLPATVEMQTQTVTFAFSDGVSIPVTNTAVVQP